MRDAEDHQIAEQPGGKSEYKAVSARPSIFGDQPAVKRRSGKRGVPSAR